MQAPSYPDPTATAQTQADINKSSAVTQQGLNLINQQGPNGSLSYSQIGTWSDGTPRYQATTSLSPEQQGILNSSNQINQNLGNIGVSQSQRLGQLLNNPMDTSGVTPLATSLPAGFTGNRQESIDNLMKLQQPLLDRQRASLEQRLANQGLKGGDEAYTNAENDFGLQENNARLQAISQAGQEQQLGQNLGLNAANFQNQTNQLQLQNLTNQRNQGLNEILALGGQTQVQNPQFQTTPTAGVQSPDYTGLAQGQYQAQNNAYNGFWGGVGNLASGVGGFLFSDKSLKEDIRDTGARTKDGIPLKEFAYKGSPIMHLGVIAQDVEKKRPDAVKTIMGKKAVDYHKVGSPMLSLGKRAA